MTFGLFFIIYVEIEKAFLSRDEQTVRMDRINKRDNFDHKMWQ